MDGLNRYDGYNFKVYKHDPANNQSLAENFITFLYEDSLGTYESEPKKAALIPSTMTQSPLPITVRRLMIQEVSAAIISVR